MAKYGFSSTIPYGTDLFEVTGIEYCEWEDALEKCDTDDTNAMEWATYDVLIKNGYFVSQPKQARPLTAEQKAEQEKTKPKGKVKTKEKVRGAVRDADATRASPGIRDVTDLAFDNLTANLISGDTREPIWTQSRILAERDKLLREREKMTELKEKALAQKILEQQILERFRAEDAKVVIGGVTPADIVAYIIFGLMIFGMFVFGLISYIT